MKLDLIFKDITDPLLRENFFRLQRDLNAQVLLQPDFVFMEFDVPEASLSYAIPHGLKYIPTDIILLATEGDQNFYFRYDQFDGTNLYVGAHGPVRVRALVGRIERAGKRRLKESDLPFVAPIVGGGGGLGGSGSDGWAFIQDSTYTAGSPLTILSGVRTKIPNDALGVLTNYVNAPANASTWWDAANSRFHPSTNGDFYTFRLNLTANPTQSNKTIIIDYDIGTANLPYAETKPLSGGAGVAMKIAEAIPAPIGSSAFANGITFFATASCDTDLSAISLTIIRDFVK